MRPLYSDFVSLANAGAAANGYADDGQYCTRPQRLQLMCATDDCVRLMIVLQVLALVLRHAC